MSEHADERRLAEALILEHLPDIVTLCNRMFRQRSDAEDATHEAVIAVLRALPSFERRGPVRHWVLKVALNAARQHRRTLSRKTRRETALPDHGLSGAEMPNVVDEREEQESLRVAIAELPEDLNETLTLYYFHNLTQTQIAECVGCSQKTVHVRVKKGLGLLSRRLAGSTALGAMVAAGGTGTAMLDVVSPALLSAVERSVAGHFAATAATAATAAGQAAAGSSLTSTGIATGGIVMNAKLFAGAAVLAITCLVGGAVLSRTVFADDGDEVRTEQIAVLRQRLDDSARELQSVQGDLATAGRRSAARVSELTRELQTLREAMGEKDRELAALAERAGGLDSAAASAREPSRKERWEELQETLSPVLLMLQKMQEEGANQFELGPQMVGELGKLSDDDYAKMLVFDAEETDPQIIAEIRAVMLQALIFVPKVAPHRDDYMARYIERARNGGYGANFTAGALRRISFHMPPFVDAYAKIVTPMNDDLRREFVDMALQRAADGVNDSERMDGVTFLARTPGARATEQLTDVFRQPANSARLRIAAVRGLAERADEDVLRLLRDAEGTEQNPQVLAAVKQAAAQVEKRVAAQR